jgi:aerobic-type carbon monoxide dehydrogenase small subunit (CoxS/CutS family)
VLVDGRAASSCLQLTSMVEGRSVQTAESVLGEVADEAAASVLDTFVDRRAYQCSYCIPAMALTVASLLRDRPDLTVHDIREELAGNLCRCGSYPQVLEAVSTLVKGKANQP